MPQPTDLSQVSEWLLDAFIEDELAELNRSYQAQLALLDQRIEELEGPFLQQDGPPYGRLEELQRKIPLNEMLHAREGICKILNIPYPKEWTYEEKRWLAHLSKQALGRLAMYTKERMSNGDDVRALFGWEDQLPPEGHTK